MIPMISIHAPRGGSDQEDPVKQPSHYISIHAPRGGSDPFWLPHHAADEHFNPRSPWGERPFVLTSKSLSSRFQSTLPVGGATL